MLPQFLIIEGAVTCDITRGSAQEFRMVNYCVAFGCTSSSKHGISVFRFPKDMKLHSKFSYSRLKELELTGVDLRITQYYVAYTLPMTVLKHLLRAMG